MLGIPVTVSVNVINHAMFVSIQIMKTKCRKQLVDKLVEEGGENIDEAKLTEIDLFEHANESACSYTVFIVLGAIALTIRDKEL